MQHSIPCVMMRGGTSRGLYFRASDLPGDTATRDAVLLAAMGSADPSQIDGAGGATSLTSKVAIVGPSSHPWADVDYTFAQVGTDNPVVDTGPSCGNILAGVGPFAIETGLVPAEDGETTVRVHDVNTGSLVDCTLQTPGRRVRYDGETAIDGVPGTAAPIRLSFRNIAGGKTGHLFPTGSVSDTVCGVDVTCIDLAVPIVLVAAESLGNSGHETKQALDEDDGLLARLEEIRRAAGEKMGLGDVAGTVIPKIAMLANPKGEAGISSRYFVPDHCHAAHAATGAIAVAGASQVSGTVAHTQCTGSGVGPVRIEHPKGAMEIGVDVQGSGPSATVRSASVVRTARPIFSGAVHVPAAIWRCEEVLPVAA